MADLLRLADDLEEMVATAEAKLRHAFAAQMLHGVPTATLIDAGRALVAAQTTRRRKTGKRLEDCTDAELEAAAGLIQLLRGGTPGQIRTLSDEQI
ncbi:hypothetical protein HKCCSP123_06230 [Rhodobacterales bacterium HKCCSP123]|nr:hypothetical protein [Rhodobacterales bacterium HKCCSP123]